LEITERLPTNMYDSWELRPRLRWISYPHESLQRFAAGRHASISHSQHAHELADNFAHVTPIDTFTATWDRHGLVAANIHEYINDAPGGCTWPLRRRTLDPMPESSDESDNSDSDEEYYGDDEHYKAPLANATENETNSGRTPVDRQDSISQLNDDSNTIGGESANTDALSDDASIEHWLDAQPSTWLHDKDEILTSSDFRICHAEEHDPYTLRMLYLRATAPGRVRSSSVVTVLRDNERGRVWDLDEHRHLVWRKRSGSPASQIDIDGMTTEQLEPSDLPAMQQQHSKSATLAGQCAPAMRAQRFRLKKKSSPKVDARTHEDGPKYKMAQYVRSLEKRLGQLSLKDQPSLEERLARLSLRDKPRKAA
jgi:hypothetical protein